MTDKQPNADIDIDLSTPISEDASDFIPLHKVETLAALLAHWHNRALMMAMQIKQVPPGIEMDYHDTEAGISKKIVLQGEVREAFLAGMDTCLHLFAKLPIAMEFEETPAAEPATETNGPN